MHFWGRTGHNLVFLASGTSQAVFTEDQAGVLSLDWENAFSASEIRNRLSAFYDRDWTRSAGKDEAYAGSVVSEDLTSQEKYGLLTNEVVGVDNRLTGC